MAASSAPSLSLSPSLSLALSLCLDSSEYKANLNCPSQGTPTSGYAELQCHTPAMAAPSAPSLSLFLSLSLSLDSSRRSASFIMGEPETVGKVHQESAESLRLPSTASGHAPVHMRPCATVPNADILPAQQPACTCSPKLQQRARHGSRAASSGHKWRKICGKHGKSHRNASCDFQALHCWDMMRRETTHFKQIKHPLHLPRNCGSNPIPQYPSYAPCMNISSISQNASKKSLRILTGE